MKIRSGFVSNSSSSSFVVILPREPASVFDFVQQMLPLGIKRLSKENQKLWEDASLVVWHEIAKTQLLQGELEKITEGLLQLYNSEQIGVWPKDLMKKVPRPRTPRFKHKTGLSEEENDKVLDEYSCLCDNTYDAWVEKVWKETLKLLSRSKKEYPDPRLLRIRVEDHTPLGSFMEHQNIFRRFIYFQESNH